MSGQQRCGTCENCQKFKRGQASVLKAVNPPFSHADDGVVQVWNDVVKLYPCTAPLPNPMRYTIQCMDHNTGKTGCFGYDPAQGATASTFKAITPVCRDLVEFFGYASAHGIKITHNPL